MGFWASLFFYLLHGQVGLVYKKGSTAVLSHQGYILKIEGTFNAREALR